MVIGVNGGDTTQSLLREFETVLGDVEACHQIASTTTLTPPQSPPPILCKQQQQQHLLQSQAHLLVSLQPIHQQQQTFVYEQQQHQHQYHEEHASITNLHGQPQSLNTSYAILLNNGNATNEPINQHQQQQHVTEQWTAENLSLDPLVHSGDVAQELAQVDEYVRSCAEDVAPSPSCSSTSCSSEDSSDPDWSFESSSASTSSSPRKISSTGRGAGGRRGNKPYSRPNVEDKRVRKKEQNKNAATRYRQKKKQEIKEIVGEEQELNNKNEQLQVKVKDLQREIGYLKGLMRDLFKAKGLLK
ncbi:transcription factor atf-4 homolog [Phymastichus coffea]|uniref:transcription factor atf-4 homolog n=1 Tax=Phymastichus coffea TaxID=108790 RepID=UPI00273CA877|nr:transcription factor atf-4 homolog [Phymastichus coffea]